jgi:chaperonin GroES
MKMRPMSDRVVVQRQRADDRSAGGIIIPDAAQKKTSRGEVLAVGPGRLNEKGERVPVDVAVGDVVLFGDYSGTEISLDGEGLLVIREDDLHLVLGKPEA